MEPSSDELADRLSMMSRTVAQRIIDAQHLFASEVDCFFATTNPDGHPNVVPLSAVWHGGVFILCTRRSTRTIRNVRARPFARLIYGTTRDVALVDTTVDITDLASAEPSALASFHRHVGWDIAAEDGRYVAVMCRPQTIQAWWHEPEATLMEAGAWLAWGTSPTEDATRLGRVPPASQGRTLHVGRFWGIYAVMVWSLDDKQPYNDPAIAALRDTASDLGLELRLAHLGTRGQLAFAVPVAGLDYWRASLHKEGKRGAVAYELRNTALGAAQAVLAAYEKSQRDPNPFS